MKANDRKTGQPSEPSSRRQGETTYEEVNLACKEIHWPQMTEAIHSILSRAGSDAAPLSSDERRALGERFWNECVYREYEKIYLDLFPRDKSEREAGMGTEDVSSLDYNRKMILAFTQWLECNGFFHSFGGRILFLKYDSYALSMGSLLTDGALYDAFDEKATAALLNKLSTEYLECRAKYEKAIKWLWGCGTVLALLMLGLVMKITG